MDDELMTPADAAAQIGVSRAYLVRLAEEAGIALIRVGPDSCGGRWLIRAADVAELARGRPRDAAPSPAAEAQRRSRARRRGEDTE